jgi:hypothetical protein
MYSHTDRVRENISHSVSKAGARGQNNKPLFQVVNNRPEVTAQLKLKKMASAHPRASQLKTLQRIALAPAQRTARVIQRNSSEAPTIAKGHSYTKHVVDQQEWGSTPMDKAAFGFIVKEVMTNPDASKALSGGRKAYWKGDTLVIYDPSTADKGTCFKPRRGKAYYDSLS